MKLTYRNTKGEHHIEELIAESGEAMFRIQLDNGVELVVLSDASLPHGMLIRRTDGIPVMGDIHPSGVFVMIAPRPGEPYPGGPNLTA
jgi:hypothetical protein